MSYAARNNREQMRYMANILTWVFVLPIIAPLLIRAGLLFGGVKALGLAGGASGPAALKLLAANGATAPVPVTPPASNVVASTARSFPTLHS